MKKILTTMLLVVLAGVAKSDENVSLGNVFVESFISSVEAAETLPEKCLDIDSAMSNHECYPKLAGREASINAVLEMCNQLDSVPLNLCSRLLKEKELITPIKKAFVEQSQAMTKAIIQNSKDRHIQLLKSLVEN